MPAATSNTVFGIIADAMHDAGLLPEGEQPNSEQLATYQRRLCDVINLWQTQGLKLFLLQDVTIPLVSGQNKYVLGPAGDVVMSRPLRVEEAYHLSTDDIRRPLVPLSWEEWTSLSQVDGNDGMVSSYFVDIQSLVMNFYVWNTPDTSEALNTVHAVLRTQAPNPINLEENVSFPQEWRIALRWGLADDIATGQPQAIMDRCQQRAVAYREMLENWDVENVPTRFTPSAQSQSQASGWERN